MAKKSHNRPLNFDIHLATLPLFLSSSSQAPIVAINDQIWPLILLQSSTKSQRTMLPDKLRLLWSPDTSLICPSCSQRIQRSCTHHPRQPTPLILPNQEAPLLLPIVHGLFLCLHNLILLPLATPQPLQMGPTARTAFRMKTHSDGDTKTNMRHQPNPVVQTGYWVITPLAKP